MIKPKIIVIGGGPAGEAAARTASLKGADVTLVEKDFLGGLCLNYGCIPSKTLLETVRKLHHLKGMTPYGVQSNGTHLEWKALQKRKGEIVSDIRSRIEKHLQTLRVRLLSGEARFINEHEIAVKKKDGDEKLSFDSAIIAGGTNSFFPPPLDEQRNELLDSRSILELASIPKSLLVIGGGAVGCEFACLFHELGTQVTIIEKTEGLIPGEDANIVASLKSAFEARGIQIITGVTVASLSGKSGAWDVKLSNNQNLSSEQILVSIGRGPDTNRLGLDAAGIASHPKGVPINERMQTNKPHIYAIGDITGTTRLAHAAAAQGEVAALNACGENAVFDGSLVPRCLYTWPEVASVGLWSHEAEAKGISIKSQRSFFKGSSTGIIEGEADGFFQILSDKTTGKILGAQIIGPDATELIHIFCVAIKAGMTTKDLKSVIFAHPSLAEGIKEALSK